MSVPARDLGPTCMTCGKVPPKTLDQSWEDWEQMQFCGPECAPPVRLSRADLIAEIEHLKGSASPREIALRVGYSNLDSLTTRLRRCGRHDLAIMFERKRR